MVRRYSGAPEIRLTAVLLCGACPQHVQGGPTTVGAHSSSESPASSPVHAVVISSGSKGDRTDGSFRSCHEPCSLVFARVNETVYPAAPLTQRSALAWCYCLAIGLPSIFWVGPSLRGGGGRLDTQDRLPYAKGVASAASCKRGPPTVRNDRANRIIRSPVGVDPTRLRREFCRSATVCGGMTTAPGRIAVARSTSK